MLSTSRNSSDTHPTGEYSFLDREYPAFVRLVGTTSFKKHSFFHCNTLCALYMSLEETGLSTREQHKQFIQLIREEVWSSIIFEDELPPSFKAL